jgi:hypothetical protein
MGVKFDGTSNTGLTSRQGALTIYLVDALAADGSNGTAQIAGPAPAVSTMSTSWTSPTLAGSNVFSEMKYASLQGAGTFGTTTLPSGTPSGGDCFVTATTLTGKFPAGAWTINVAVIVSGGSTPSGTANLMVRIWHSGDGVNFTEVTAGATACGNFNLATTTQQNTTLTTASLATFAVNNERLYFQFALEEQTPATAAGTTVAIVQDGTNSVVTTPNFAVAIPQSNHTFCCFFNPSALPGNAVIGTLWCVADAQQGTFTNANDLQIEGTAANAEILYQAGGATLTSATFIQANSWYFVALVVDASGNNWVYTKAIGAPHCTVVTSAISVSFTPAELTLGTNGTGASGLEFGAMAIAHARVWLSALSAADIERESFSLPPVRTADLWEYWPLVSDVDVVGRIRGTVLAANVLSSSNTPFSGPILATARPLRSQRR